LNKIKRAGKYTIIYADEKMKSVFGWIKSVFGNW